MGVEVRAREVKIGIVVLAAGASTRMGAPKQLMPFGETSLLRRAAEQALGSICRPVIVVTGAHAALTRNEIADLPVTIIENLSWASGIGSSISRGVATLDETCGDAAGVVITVCDQPFVTAKTISELVETYRATNAGIVAAEYDGTLGVPALFSHLHFAELLTLSGAVGAKQIIARHSSTAHPVPFARGTIDIDTPEDYARMRSAMAPPFAR